MPIIPPIIACCLVWHPKYTLLYMIPNAKQENIIITPHIAGTTNKYWAEQYDLFSENLRRYKKGLKLKNLKNSYQLRQGY